MALKQLLLTLLICGALASKPIGAAQPAASLNAGRALYVEGKFQEAEAAFKDAVAHQPKSAEAHYWLGMAQLAQARHDDALKRFKQAVKLDKTLTEAHIALGRAYLQNGKKQDARKTLEKAARIDPANADIPYYIGLSYVRTVITREHGVDGRSYFRRAIELNPNHPDAHYQLGLTYEEDPARNPGKAIPYYFDQLVATPGHADALTHLTRCSLQTGQLREVIEIAGHIAVQPGADGNPHLRAVQAQLDAVYLHAQQKYEEAFKRYETYLAALDPEERAFYMDLRYVASREDFDRYQHASPDEQAELYRKFWAARDPDPSTVVNERLVEHYRRVMVARTNFSQSQTPWDRRGDIYVRYGEPDNRQNLKVFSGVEAELMTRPRPFEAPGSRFAPQRASVGFETTQDARVDAIREVQHSRYQPPVVGSPVIESWVYTRYNLELTFSDPWKKGIYDYPPAVNLTPRNMDYHPKKMAETLIAKSPESYRHDYGGEMLEFIFDAVTYKGEDGRAQVDVAYSVPARQLGYVGDGQPGDRTYFDSHIVLRDGDWNRTADTGSRIGPIERPRFKIPKNRDTTELRTASLSLLAPPGRYRAAVSVRDSLSRRIGIYEAPLTVWNYENDALNMSDIKLSTAITPGQPSGPFVRNGLEIIPNPAHLYQQTQPVYLYYEVYNLSKDNDGRTAYRTDLEISAREKEMHIVWRFLSGFGRLMKKSDEPQTVILSFEDEGAKPDDYKFTSIDTGESPAADYTLTLTVTDLHNGQTITRSTAFTVADDGKRSAVEDDEPASIDMKVKP